MATSAARMNGSKLIVTTANSLTRGCLAKNRAFHGSALTKGMSPPLPAFKRNPLKQSSLIENYDALWDDGVAPELALDFDMPSVSSSEALYTWMGAFGIFFGLFQVIRFATGDDNPAASHSTDCVDKDWSDGQMASSVSS